LPPCLRFFWPGQAANMARYEHLPIYKKAMDVAIHVEKIVGNFSRYHMYTLGSELRQKSREVVGAIIRANSKVEKLPSSLSCARSSKDCWCCCESRTQLELLAPEKSPLVHHRENLDFQ
jgi:hypothetical protein